MRSSNRTHLVVAYAPGMDQRCPTLGGSSPPRALKFASGPTETRAVSVFESDYQNAGFLPLPQRSELNFADNGAESRFVQICREFLLV